MNYKTNLYLLLISLLVSCSTEENHAKVTHQAVDNLSVLNFPNGIELHVTIDTFEVNKHQIDTCFSVNRPYICQIDKKAWFGMDMGLELPKFQLSKLVVLYKGKHITLEVSQMFNPVFDTRISEKHFKARVVNEQLEISGWFSDGAGTYCARWQIVDGTAKRTLLSSDEEKCFGS